MYIIKLAFRNIFRNKLRTIVTIISISIGLAALIFYDAVIYGINNSLIYSATSSFAGELQIHNKEFIKTLHKEYIINDTDAIINNLLNEPNVKNFSLRILSIATLSLKQNFNQLLLYGINLENEKNTSSLSEHIILGSYESINDNKILISEKTAKILNVSLNDSIIITLNHNSNTTQNLIKIGGIFKFNNEELDAKVSFVAFDFLKKILDLEYGAHEITINFNNIKLLDENFLNKYSNSNNIARAWYEIFNELKVLLNIISYSINIIALGLFLIIAFGIINTIFMSFHERKYEFSMLKALGLNNNAISYLIILENLFINLISILFGIIIALIVIKYFSFYGINYNDIEITGVNFNDKLYPVLNYLSLLKFAIILLIYSILISIIPALYSTKLLVSSEIKNRF